MIKNEYVTTSDGEVAEVSNTYEIKINNDTYIIDVVIDFENNSVYFSLHIQSPRGLMFLKSDSVLLEDFEENNPLLPHVLYTRGLSDEENSQLSSFVISKIIDVRKVASQCNGV